MDSDQRDRPDAAGRDAPPVAIVVSRYNGSVMGAMLDGAVGAYRRRGGDESRLGVIDAPGAYELVSIASVAAESGLYAGVVCLGCVIRGETSHDAHIAGAVASGLATISVRTGVPVAFGVLTVNTAEQAAARAGGGKGNKGEEAMDALLDAVSACDAIRRATAPGIRYGLAGLPADKASGPGGTA